MRIMTRLLTVLTVLCVTSLGFAEPLMTLKDGTPEPGVVTGWSGSGKKIELSLRANADPQAVAAAIESGLERVRVKVKAGKLLVLGLSQDDLLKALTEIKLGGDDLDVLAAAAASDDDYDTGSSIRAKKTDDLAKLLADRATTAVGRVKLVSSGSFPNVRVAVQILRGPSGPLSSRIRKGQTIVFFPVIKKTRAGQPDLSDGETVANIGAWFLKKNDVVTVRVGASIKGGFEAAVIMR